MAKFDRGLPVQVPTGRSTQSLPSAPGGDGTVALRVPSMRLVLAPSPAAEAVADQAEVRDWRLMVASAGGAATA